MAAYSMDLRKRVARTCDRGIPVAAVAAQFEVSVAWVYRLLQRRRETGSISPRQQTKFRGRSLSSDEEVRLVALITVKPDATLAELQQALPTRAALSTLWRAIDRLGLTVKKNGTRRRAATP
jgi:transposase